MKIIHIIAGAFLCVLCLSCEDYLDKAPEMGITEDDIFSDYSSLRGYLDKCYMALNDIHAKRSQDNMSNTSINALSDEMGSVFNGNNNSQLASALNTGNWIGKPNLAEVGWNGGTAGDSEANIIKNAFYCIRIANKLINDADKMQQVSEEQKNEIVGQAHFMRAWYYFELIKRVGGMPLLDRAFNPDEDMDLPRLTYHESSEWVISDLDKAIELLPHDWPESDIGRANKAAAMAVKSMAALYDASPLMQNNLTTLQVHDYDIERCKIAARYANDVLKYIQEMSGQLRYRLMSGNEYASIFRHEPVFVSDESLWYNNRASVSGFTTRQKALYQPERFTDKGSGSDAASFSDPTQNIVDKFEAINPDDGMAYPIDHFNSKYDAQNPFVNRDPRLSNNIIVPGEKWGLDGGGKTLYQELYIGGLDYLNVLGNNFTNTREVTGYVCKKYIWEEANRKQKLLQKYIVNTIYIRVSQIYLDYAEAMNEAYGPEADPEGYGMTAVDAINTIRNRVNMPDVLPEFTASKETFRERIRNERAVELMFENHRWHDMRRWMTAHVILEGSNVINGLFATPPAGHKKIADKSTLIFNYEVKPLASEQRVFQMKHYWYPMDQPHVQMLYNLQQNPGW